MATKEATKPMQTRLTSQKWNGRVYIGVDLPWREPIKIVAQQVRFLDQVLALAGLPERDQWPKILAVSQRYQIPSIRNRVSASPLESGAAALLTALAFSNYKDWAKLVSSFFKSHNLTPGLVRGRPRLHPRDMKDMTRSIQIDNLIARLEKGFEIKLRAKHGGGFASGDEQTAKKLRNLRYGDEEIKAILKSKTLQDAGCRLFEEIGCKTHDRVSLQTIRNSYAKYKLLPGTKPPLQGKSSRSNKDSQ